MFPAATDVMASDAIPVCACKMDLLTVELPAPVQVPEVASKVDVSPSSKFSPIGEALNSHKPKGFGGIALSAIEAA
jgi:hypothetical protein